MKKTIGLFLFAFILLSCSRNTSNKELLTSHAWKLVDKDSSQTAETLQFRTDGTYTLEASDLKVNGKWSWQTDNEIHVITEGLSSDNGKVSFDKTSNYNIRIKEISNKSLSILEKGEGDTWDGGFAKTKVYVAQDN